MDQTLILFFLVSKTLLNFTKTIQFLSITNMDLRYFLIKKLN